MKRRTTRLVLAVIVVAALVGTTLFLRGRSARAGASAESPGAPARATRSAPNGGGDRPVPVSTVVATRKDVPVVLEGLGTVTPLASVAVKSQVDGRLDRVLFIEGQHVKKGEVIALIDPRPFNIQLHSAEAALYRDDAQLRNGTVNLERFETLRQGKLIPQQQADDQHALVAQLQAAVQTDKAQIESARLNLDYARITSPIDGVTGIRQVDPGNLVHQNDANGIVTITQIDPIAVLFTLPQDDLPRVQRAMHERKVTVEAYARDGIQKLAAGELLLVDNQINPQTATIRLKSVFPNPEHVLWPAAFVKARMRLTTLEGVLVVPASVVQRGPSGTFGYVVNPDNTIAVRPIEVASLEGDVAVIAKGLQEGDVVVTDGQNQLKPGSRIAPRPNGPASASAPPGASSGSSSVPKAPL